MTKKMLLIWALAAALIASGCGDDDEPQPEASGTTAVETEAPAEELAPAEASDEYDAAVAEIQDANAAFEEDVNAAIQAGDLEGVQSAAAAYATARSEFGERIASIGFPAEVQSEVDALVVANEAVIGALETVDEAGQVEAAQAAVQVAADLTSQTGDASEALADRLVALRGG